PLSESISMPRSKSRKVMGGLYLATCSTCRHLLLASELHDDVTAGRNSGARWRLLFARQAAADYIEFEAGFFRHLQRLPDRHAQKRGRGKSAFYLHHHRRAGGFRFFSQKAGLVSSVSDEWQRFGCEGRRRRVV